MEQLFDFKLFVDELRNDPEKREIIEQYETKVESFHGIEDVRDTVFYKEYLSQYNLPKGLNFVLKVPEELYYDYDDWDLLLRLVFASFSSSYSLSLTEEWKQNPTDKVEIMLQITVSKDPQKVTKKLDELWSFQIIRLLEIYIEEQMNLATLKKQEEERVGIESDRQIYIKKFNDQIKRINAIVDDHKTNLFLEDFV